MFVVFYVPWFLSVECRRKEFRLLVEHWENMQLQHCFDMSTVSPAVFSSNRSGYPHIMSALPVTEYIVRHIPLLRSGVHLSCLILVGVKIALQLLPQVHWGFDQPLTWAWLA